MKTLIFMVKSSRNILQYFVHKAGFPIWVISRHQWVGTGTGVTQFTNPLYSRLRIQMLMLTQSVLTETPRILFHQVSRYPMAQPSWHVKKWNVTRRKRQETPDFSLPAPASRTEKKSYEDAVERRLPTSQEERCHQTPTLMEPWFWRLGL